MYRRKYPFHDFPSFNIGKRILISREGLQRWVDFYSSLPLSDLSDNAAKVGNLLTFINKNAFRILEKTSPL